jgi:hypothetical protein
LVQSLVRPCRWSSIMHTVLTSFGWPDRQ